MIGFEDILRRVRQPAAYTGGEANAVRKDPARLTARVALAYPDLYVIGMSYLGLQILYEAVNRQPDLWAERVFAPAPDLAARLQETGILLCTLESRTPLAEFDLVGFSAQHELNLVDVLRMLKLGGIPMRAEQRDQRHPVVVMGGPGAAQPEPLAPALDAVYLGDGEEGLVEMARLVGTARRRGWPRRKILEQLQQLEGVYLPNNYRMSFASNGVLLDCQPLAGAPARVRRRVLPDLETVSPPAAPLVATCRPVHDRLTVEIQRGCTRGCRFCQAGMINRPVRQRSAASVLDAVGRGIAATGHDQVSLLSLSAGDHPQLIAILQELLREGGMPLAVSLPSLRAETLSGDIAVLIRRVRKSGFTIAPEAGSERLRRVINKNLTQEDVLAAARAAFQAGWRLIKLYFMIGLPGETDEDRRQIVDLVRLVREESRRVRGSRLHVGISTFVPKAHTPFQWEAMFSVAETIQAQNELRRRLADLGGVKMGWSRAWMSWLEGVLSRADRRIFPALEALVERGEGLLAWSEHFDEERIRHTFEPVLRALPDPLAARLPDQPLPWDHLDLGPSREFLLAERERARQGVATADCVGGECLACGACGGEVSPRLAPEKPLPLRASTVGTELRSKVRLRLAKCGQAVFLGHLDFAAQIARAMRRAGWTLAYSHGHHPQPRLSFGPACPVGVESWAEWLDVELQGEAPADLESFGRSLVEQLPAGVTLEGLRRLRPGEPGIQKLARAQRWRLYAPPQLGEEKISSCLRKFRQKMATAAAEEITARHRSIIQLREERGAEGWQTVVDVALGKGPQMNPCQLAQELFGSEAWKVVKESLLFSDAEGAEPFA